MEMAISFVNRRLQLGRTIYLPNILDVDIVYMLSCKHRDIYYSTCFDLGELQTNLLFYFDSRAYE